MENFDDILKQLEEQLETIQAQQQEEPQPQQQQQVQQQPVQQQEVEQSNQFYYEIELQRFIAKHPDIPNLHQLLPHIVQKANEIAAQDNNRKPYAEYLEQGMIEVVRTLASITKETLSSLSFTGRQQPTKRPAQPVDPKEAIRKFHEDYYNMIKKATVKGAYVDARLNDNGAIREVKGNGLLKLGDKISLD